MSSTLERATEALQAQADKGMAKYQTPLESAGHKLSELLVHKQQEAADMLMYTTEAIERARELEAENFLLRRIGGEMRYKLLGFLMVYEGVMQEVVPAKIEALLDSWVDATEGH